MNGRVEGTGPGLSDDVLLQRLLRTAGRDGDRTRLPPERELTELLEVSRPTVRDRLSLLEGIGALERRTGSGTFLRRLGPTDLAGILQLAGTVGTFSDGGLSSLRVALEAEAAALAAERRAGDQLVQLVADRDGTREADALVAFDSAFRAELVAASGDSGLVFFHTSLTLVLDQSAGERHWRGLTLAGDPNWAWAEYWTLSVAVASGDTATATAVARRHAQWLSGQTETAA